MTKLNDKEIDKDRQERVGLAKEELEAILKKYELQITAEDTIAEHTKIKVAIQFVDIKNYDSKLAQEDRPIISDEQFNDLLKGKGDKI